jgi:hypothetical protein
MATFVAKAIADRERGLPTDLVVGFGPHSLRLTAATSAALVAQVKRRGGSHNARRRQIETLLFRHFHAAYQAAEARIRRVGLRPQVDDELAAEGVPAPAELTQQDVARELRRDVTFLTALDRMWPRLTPQQLLHDLFGARPLLQLAGRNLLEPEEVELLFRRRSDSVDAVAWTDADVPILDEARALLGPLRHKAGGDDPDEIRAYGHIVVDEAQDLSPMQLRMLNRRSLSGSMTVVGDIAQSTGHFAPGSWDDVLAHLPTRRGARVTELTVNYRTPLEIMTMAGRVLAHAAPDLRAPDSVRASGDDPVIFPTSTNVAAAAASAIRDELAAVGDGTISVIVPPSLHGAVADGLTAAGLEFGEASRRGLDAQVTLVPIGVVKGLEFDGVVVVEPARIVAESPQGLRALYVALTRATQRLTIVHGEPLPSALLE